jgi:hypothetical protein
MYSRSFHRFLAGVAGLGALALLVPSLALGGVVLDDQTGLTAHASVAFLTSHGVLARYDDSSTVNQIRPDNRAGALGAEPVVADPSVVTSARPDDRTGPLGATPITTASKTASVSYSNSSDASSGFQWGDAAIGAATMLAIFGLALVAVTLQRQHRRSVVAH